MTQMVGDVNRRALGCLDSGLLVKKFQFKVSSLDVYCLCAGFWL